MNRKVLIHQVNDNIRAHWGTTLTGVATTTISLVILGTFFLVYQNLIHITEIFFNQSHYSVFLSERPSEADRQNVINRLSRVPGVHDIHVVSPDQARAELLDAFKEARPVLEKVNFTRLPWVIDFSLTREGGLSEAEIAQIESIPKVDELYFGRETKDQVETFFGLANFVGLFLVALLVVSILFIIKNTIQIGVRMRFQEIEILSHLGATRRFIGLPFLIEGGLIGASAAAAALGVVYFLYQFVLAGVTFNQATYGLPLVVRFYSVGQAVGLILGLFVIGLLSSHLATGRILKSFQH
ncbi:MAG: permease-like cell division protein FtsX [bacterium]|nr:permease-like cell division protein FtsX [bacterium]